MINPANRLSGRVSRTLLDDRYAIVNYQIRRQEDGSAWTEWTSTSNYNTSGNTATLVVSGLVNGTEYKFQVRGTNSIPKSDPTKSTTHVGLDSNDATAPLRSPGRPGRSDRGPFQHRWHRGAPLLGEPHDNIDKYQYRVRVSTAPACEPDWTVVSNSGGDTTEVTVTGLTKGTEYEFQVRAVDTDRDEGDQVGPASTITATPATDAVAPAQMIGVSHTVNRRARRRRRRRNVLLD